MWFKYFNDHRWIGWKCFLLGLHGVMILTLLAPGPPKPQKKDRKMGKTQCAFLSHCILVVVICILCCIICCYLCHTFWVSFLFLCKIFFFFLLMRILICAVFVFLPKVNEFGYVIIPILNQWLQIIHEIGYLCWWYIYWWEYKWTLLWWTTEGTICRFLSGPLTMFSSTFYWGHTKFFLLRKE